MAGKAARRNIGGGTWYNAKGSNVQSEALEKKDGGPVKKKAGGPVEKRKFGGRSVGKPEGRMAGGRLDKRARGGGIRKLATGGGADKAPFSSAASSVDHAKPSGMSGSRAHVGRATGGSVTSKKK